MPDDVDPSPSIWPGLSSSATVALVGNAPGTGGGAVIDAADAVVRFNNAAGFGDRAGGRVTHLVLVNRGGQMREWLADPGFLDRPVVRQARAFVLPFPMLPEEHNRPEPICFTREALAMLRPLGRPVHTLPQSLHDEAWRRLAAHGSARPNPSTGFLTMLALRLGRPDGAAPVEAHGFGFDGWSGHPWEAERAWFTAEAAAGRLRLYPPTDDG